MLYFSFLYHFQFNFIIKIKHNLKFIIIFLLKHVTESKNSFEFEEFYLSFNERLAYDASLRMEK